MSMAQYLKDRAGREDETLTAWATVELTAHTGYGAVIECLVTFTQTPVVKCSSFCRREDAFPDEGGERGLVSVVPHIRVSASMSAKAEELQPMDCPVWLAETLAECIDLGELEPSED